MADRFSFYPEGFSEENKKDFDEIRDIAESIKGFSALVYVGFLTVLIEVDADVITPEMRSAISGFNAEHHSLSVSYALTKNCVNGERFSWK